MMARIADKRAVLMMGVFVGVHRAICMGVFVSVLMLVIMRVRVLMRMVAGVGVVLMILDGMIVVVVVNFIGDDIDLGPGESPAHYLAAFRDGRRRSGLPWCSPKARTERPHRPGRRGTCRREMPEKHSRYAILIEMRL